MQMVVLVMQCKVGEEEMITVADVTGQGKIIGGPLAQFVGYGGKYWYGNNEAVCGPDDTMRW